MQNGYKKWQKKKLRKKGKPAGPTSKEVARKFLSPNFTSKRDKRCTGLGGVIPWKAAVVDGYYLPDFDLKPKTVILRRKTSC